jgi:hypothetical protein
MICKQAEFVCKMGIPIPERIERSMKAVAGKEEIFFIQLNYKFSFARRIMTEVLGNSSQLDFTCIIH